MAPADFVVVARYVVGIVGLSVAVPRRITCCRLFFVAGGGMTTPLLACTRVSTYYGLDVLFSASSRQ